MLARRAYVPNELLPSRTSNRWQWPLDVPCVAQLVKEGMTFERPVTFLVGENGSGKSTLVEAFAEAWGLDARGGRAGRKYVNDRPKTPLGEMLKFETTALGARHRSGTRTKRRGYFHRAETAFGFMNVVSGMQGYWEDDTDAMSHGEGFLTVFENMFKEPGFYLLDEPEAALSFQSCMNLVALMYRLGESGAQIICATHSPLLASTPGADIIEVGDHGFRRTTWDDLALVDHWRRFMNSPTAYLRYITEE